MHRLLLLVVLLLSLAILPAFGQSTQPVMERLYDGESLSVRNNPSPDMKVEAVRLGPQQTSVRLSYGSSTKRVGGQLHPPNTPYAFRLQTADGTHYRLVEQHGWEGPEEGGYGSVFVGPRRLTFTLVFAPVPAGTRELHLIEGECREGCWHIYGIQLQGGGEEVEMLTWAKPDLGFSPSLVAAAEADRARRAQYDLFVDPRFIPGRTELIADALPGLRVHHPDSKVKPDEIAAYHRDAYDDLLVKADIGEQIDLTTIRFCSGRYLRMEPRNPGSDASRRERRAYREALAAQLETMREFLAYVLNTEAYCTVRELDTRSTPGQVKRAAGADYSANVLLNSGFTDFNVWRMSHATDYYFRYYILHNLGYIERYVTSHPSIRPASDVEVYGFLTALAESWHDTPSYAYLRSEESIRKRSISTQDAGTGIILARLIESKLSPEIIRAFFKLGLIDYEASVEAIGGVGVLTQYGYDPAAIRPGELATLPPPSEESFSEAIRLNNAAFLTSILESGFEYEGSVSDLLAASIASKRFETVRVLATHYSADHEVRVGTPWTAMHTAPLLEAAFPSLPSYRVETQRGQRGGKEYVTHELEEAPTETQVEIQGQVLKYTLSESESAELMEVLLAAGADPRATNALGRTPQEQFQEDYRAHQTKKQNMEAHRGRMAADAVRLAEQRAERERYQASIPDETEVDMMGAFISGVTGALEEATERLREQERQRQAEERRRIDAQLRRLERSRPADDGSSAQSSGGSTSSGSTSSSRRSGGGASSGRGSQASSSASGSREGNPGTPAPGRDYSPKENWGYAFCQYFTTVQPGAGRIMTHWYSAPILLGRNPWYNDGSGAMEEGMERIERQIERMVDRAESYQRTTTMQTGRVAEDLSCNVMAMIGKGYTREEAAQYRDEEYQESVRKARSWGGGDRMNVIDSNMTFR